MVAAEAAVILAINVVAGSNKNTNTSNKKGEVQKISPFFYPKFSS